MAVAPDGLHTWQRTVQLSEQDLAATWGEYRKTQAESARNVLMEHYLPLVKANSERLATKLPNEVEIDDLSVRRLRVDELMVAGAPLTSKSESQR